MSEVKRHTVNSILNAGLGDRDFVLAKSYDALEQKLKEKEQHIEDRIAMEKSVMESMLMHSKRQELAIEKLKEKLIRWIEIAYRDDVEAAKKITIEMKEIEAILNSKESEK
jgi:TorA maturation chaperone TorD